MMNGVAIWLMIFLHLFNQSDNVEICRYILGFVIICSINLYIPFRIRC